MIVTPYPKANKMKEMTCYLYPCGLLHGTNIIIANIIVFYTSYNNPTIGFIIIGLLTTYSEHPDTS